MDNSNVFGGNDGSLSVGPSVLKFEVTSNSSSNGVLAKCDYYIDGVHYIAKTGEYRKPKFSNLSPVVEVICYEMISKLGVVCAENYLYTCIVAPSLLWGAQQAIVSLSKDFLCDGETLLHASKILNSKKRRVSYSDLILGFPNNVLDINNMLIVDYILNNTDRHHKNFGLIKSLGSSRFAPLYDHGFSLGQEYDIDYLEEEWDDFSEAYSDCDYSKCCDITNSKQISNVEFHSVNLDLSLDDLLSVIDKYSRYLKPVRVDFMKYLVTRRFNYVRSLFIKDGELYRRKNRA